MDETKKTTTKYRIAAVIILIVALNFYFVFPFESIPPRTRQLWRYSFDWRHWPVWYATFLWILATGYALTTLLQSCRVQQGIRRFYASDTWRQFKYDLKNSGVNQSFVSFTLRMPFGKCVLRRWIRYWRNPYIERWHRYVFWITAFLLGGLLLENLVISEYSRRFLVNRLFNVPYHFWLRYVYNPFLYVPWIDWLAGRPFSWRQLNAPILALLLIVLLLRFNADIKRRRRKQ